MTPESTRRQEKQAEMLLLAVVTIWATNFPIAKWGIEGLGVWLFNSIRYIIALGLLAAVFFSRFTWQQVHPEDWKRLITLGVVAGVLYQSTFIIGLSMTTAGNSAVLLSTSPLWTIFLHARINKEKISRRVWLGMGISLAGVLLIIAGSGKKLEFGSDALFGDLITLTAASFWGLVTALQKPLLVRYSPMQLALVVISIGCIGLTLLSIPSALTMEWQGVHWSYYLAVLASGGLSIAFANIFWAHGVKKLGPGRTANFGNLVPVIAFVASYFLLSEEVFLIQFLGAGITIAGVWIARR